MCQIHVLAVFCRFKFIAINPEDGCYCLSQFIPSHWKSFGHTRCNARSVISLYLLYLMSANCCTVNTMRAAGIDVIYLLAEWNARQLNRVWVILGLRESVFLKHDSHVTSLLSPPKKGIMFLCFCQHRCWLAIHSVPAVTKDIFVWILGPRHS